jgi:hypothetical protein
MMPVQARRFALLIVALGIIATSLVACQTPSSANSGGSNAILIPTPNASNLTPTPKFPPFTIGAWPSDFSPDLNGTLTIYVVCRVQDQSMQGPSHPPPAGQPINVSIGNPVSQNFNVRTGADGYAVVTFNYNDPNPGQPVIVNVSAVWNGATYNGQTFFTPGPRAQPTPTKGPGGPGNGTPTVGVGP